MRPPPLPPLPPLPLLYLTGSGGYREKGVGDAWLTLPQYFKTHGYLALGTGKTFHPGSPPNFDMPLSWSNKPQTSGTANPATAPLADRPYVFSHNGYPRCVNETGRNDGTLPHSSVCPNDAPIESFSDTIDMRGSISDLQFASKAGKPFFVVFGAHRPHLPWNIPQRFWDMYPRRRRFLYRSTRADRKTCL